jgi:hypothetical protein
MKPFFFSKLRPSGRHWLAGVFALAAGCCQAQAPAWQAAVALTTYNSSSCYISAMTTTATGDVYLVGSFSGGLNLSGITVASIGGTDGFVAKWSSATSQFVWAERLAGSNSDAATGVAVSGSSVYVVGSFNSARLYVGANTTPLLNAGGYDGYIIKLTDTGAGASYTWGQAIGGSQFDEVAAVAASGANVYMTGYVGNTGAATFGALVQPQNPATFNSDDAYVAKLVDSGATSAFAWAHLSGGTDDDRGKALAVSGSSIYMTGAFQSATLQAGSTTLTNAGGANNIADVFVVKLTDAGPNPSVAWAQRAGGARDEQPSALALSGANVYVAGRFSGSTQFGTTTLATLGFQEYDGFVAKLTDAGTAGSVSWAQRIGSTSYDDAALALATAGAEVYVAGSCAALPVQFGTTLATPAGGSSYVARLTDNGTSSVFAWAQRGGGSGRDGARALALTPTGRLYVGGSYTYTGTFGPITLPDPGTYQLNTGYLAYLQGLPLATSSAHAGVGRLTLFPNPARGQVLVQVPADMAAAELIVYDALGRSVYMPPVRVLAGGGETAVSVAGLLPGLYVVRVQSATQGYALPLQVE